MHTSLIYDKAVTRSKWISDEDFLRMTSLSALVPGPNSTELVMHVGFARAGWSGLFACGLCFIIPAITIVASLAAGFSALPAGLARASSLHWANAALMGVVASALLPLVRSIGKSRAKSALAVASVSALAAGVHEVAVLILAGLVTLIAGTPAGSGSASRAILPPWEIFLAFLKIGALLYGSGYVLLAWIERDFGPGAGLLSRDDVLAAVAAGQLTPGPLFSSAGFVGYLLGGWTGALAGSVGIFLPAFAFVALTAPFAARIAGNAAATRFVEGAGIASFALLLVATGRLSFSLARETPATVVVTLAVFLALARFKPNPMLLVGLAGLLGLAWGVTFG